MPTAQNGLYVTPSNGDAAAGHHLQVADPAEGQRILPHAITEFFVTEGGTVRIRTTHAGICTVKRFSFELP